MVARSFRDLRAYQAARVAAGQVFVIGRRFPSEERFALTDQIRRSSRAVKALIAEAWARRRYKAAFVNKLNESLGEAMETQSWLDDALDCGYIDATEHGELDRTYQEIGGKLTTMIDRAAEFCNLAPERGSVREDSPEYGSSNEDL